MIRQSTATNRPSRLAKRKALPFAKQSIAHAFRVMAPTLFALTFERRSRPRNNGLLGRPDAYGQL